MGGWHAAEARPASLTPLPLPLLHLPVQELQDLASIPSAEVVPQSRTASALRQRRLSVRLCRASYDLLTHFLQVGAAALCMPWSRALCRCAAAWGRGGQGAACMRVAGWRGQERHGVPARRARACERGIPQVKRLLMCPPASCPPCCLSADAPPAGDAGHSERAHPVRGGAEGVLRGCKHVAHLLVARWWKRSSPLRCRPHSTCPPPARALSLCLLQQVAPGTSNHRVAALPCPSLLPPALKCISLPPPSPPLRCLTALQPRWLSWRRWRRT